MARIQYGRTFKTRKGRVGRYKYVNGRRVAFISSRPRKQRWERKHGKRSFYPKLGSKANRFRR